MQRHSRFIPLAERERRLTRVDGILQLQTHGRRENNGRVLLDSTPIAEIYVLESVAIQRVAVAGLPPPPHGVGHATTHLFLRNKRKRIEGSNA